MLIKLLLFCIGIFVVSWIFCGSIILYCKFVEFARNRNLPFPFWQSKRQRQQNREYDEMIAEIRQKIFGEKLDMAEVRATTQAMVMYAASNTMNTEAKRFEPSELMLAALQGNNVEEIAYEVAKCRFRVGEKSWADFIKYRSDENV